MTLSSCRVLLVDDVKESLDQLVAVLKEEYQVSIAIGGESALRSAAANPPDLVLLDLLMPEVDGFEVCRRLRAQLVNADLPVIFVSAVDDAQTKARGFEAGGTDYITKPFDAVEVRARVRSVLKGKLYQDSVRAGLLDEVRWRAAIIDASPDAIISTDLEGVITSWNPGAQRLYGHSREEAVGKGIGLIAPPGLEGEVRAMIRRALAGEDLPSWETQRQTKDGRLLDVSVSLAALRNVDGSTCGVSGVTRDITQRRAAEERLRRAEQQVRLAQKMEAIGRLTGGIVHDFNNLLSVILSYSQMLLEELRPGEPMREPIRQIELAGERAANLTRQLLVFSRQQLFEPRVLDLNEAVAGVEKMLERLVGEDIELVTVAAESLGKIRATAGGLEQVIMNLVINARDAMPGGGKLTVETANVTLDDEYARAHLGVTPGPFVMLAVSDTGTGMDEATRAHIFEPFFTTKQAGKGTGIGLATVFGIVQQAGGNIWVYSEPGHGSTFKIYLPRADGAVEPAAAAASQGPLRGSETILLVEDEDQVRAVARGILLRHGYQVLEGRNAGEALLLCEQYQGRIDLLLTDVIMPHMSGPDLARRLSTLRPELKVLCMSGYTDHGVVRNGMLDVNAAYLQKPITLQSLTRKVRDVLGPPRGAT